MTQADYNTEIEGLASNIAEELIEEHGSREEAEDYVYDRIHEIIDGHQWVIYYAYNDEVLRFSGNDDAYLDVYDNEGIGQIVTEHGLDHVGMVRAYFAMSQDVSEGMERAFNDIENGGE